MTNLLLLKVTDTSPELSSFVLRMSLGIMILPHGLQKLFGWFGGFGFQNTISFFSKNLGIPKILGALVIFVEVFGGLALLLGLGTRLAAGAVGFVLLVAAFLLHTKHGFFMNWFGNQSGEGVEFFIIALAIAVALIFQGGGKFSLDSFLSSSVKK